MAKRLRYLRGKVPEPTSYTDYYDVEALGGTYIVPLTTALTIERQLDTCAVTDWLEFRDVFGARHQLPAGHVYRVSESTRARASGLLSPDELAQFEGEMSESQD